MSDINYLLASSNVGDDDEVVIGDQHHAAMKPTSDFEDSDDSLNRRYDRKRKSMEMIKSQVLYDQMSAKPRRGGL